MRGIHGQIATWNSHDAVDDLAVVLRQRGVALVEGVGSTKDLFALARRLGTIAAHPHGKRSGITTIVPRGVTVQAPGLIGLTRRALFPHTDRTVLHDPPNLILQVLARPAEVGGEMTVADGQKVISAAMRMHPQILDRLAEKGSVRFQSGADVIEDRILAPTGDGAWVLKFRNDGGLSASAAVSEYLPLLHGLVGEHMFELPNLPGTTYIADNWRMLHGRREFVGARQALRLLLRGFEDLFGNALGMRLPPNLEAVRL